MHPLFSAFGILGITSLLVFGIIGTVNLSVSGPRTWRGRFAAWRIRSAYRTRVVRRALQIQTEHPEIEFECDNWPKYKALCGYDCAVSRAHRELAHEREQADQLLRSV